MFERLILCEYAVADLTTANANVFYELGVRHAVRPYTTVLLFAEGGRPAFDVAPVRAVPYRLTRAGQPADPAAARHHSHARPRKDDALGRSPDRRHPDDAGRDRAGHEREEPRRAVRERKTGSV